MKAINEHTISIVIAIVIAIAIAIVKAINEHTIAIVDPSTWKTHTISIHPSLVDEFLIKLKLDKRRKAKTESQDSHRHSGLC